MPVGEIELYEALKEKVGEKEAKTLLEFIESQIEKRIEDKKEVLATKGDIKNSEIATRGEIKSLEVRMKEEIKSLEVRVMEEIKSLELRMKEEIKSLEVRMKEEIKSLEVRVMDEIKNLEVRVEKTKSDIIKWMFLFWIGQLASLIAILEIFFRR